MAHKTLINGTAYEVDGGRTKVNGTGYEIAKGRTKVGGTGYDVSFDSTPTTNVYTFYIESTQYSFEHGMTWADWIGSQYNTDGYDINYSYYVVISPDGMYAVCSSVGVTVTPNDAIINDLTYILG